MTEDDIRRIFREELAARPPQIVVIPPHPQPMPVYGPGQIYPTPAPLYPGGPWPVTCGVAYAGVG